MSARFAALLGVALLAAKPSKPAQSCPASIVLRNDQLEMLVAAHLDFKRSAFQEMDYPGAPATVRHYGATLETVDGGTLIRFAPDSSYRGPLIEGGTVRYEYGIDGGLLKRVFEK